MSGRKHQGILLNISARGLFVQTHALPPKEANVSVEVRLRVPDPPTVLVAAATVVRVYKVPGRLLCVAGGGLALLLRNLPDAWSVEPEKKLVSTTPQVSLPAVGPATHARCAGCGRSDRPLSSGLCTRCVG